MVIISNFWRTWLLGESFSSTEAADNFKCYIIFDNQLITDKNIYWILLIKVSITTTDGHIYQILTLLAGPWLIAQLCVQVVTYSLLSFDLAHDKLIHMFGHWLNTLYHDLADNRPIGYCW